MELKDIFNSVLSKITKPVSQERLEYLLIEAGVDRDISRAEFKEIMESFGFIKKQMKRYGLRKMHWYKEGQIESVFLQKIKLGKWLNARCEGKTQIAFSELSKEMVQNGWDSAVYQSFFYTPSGHDIIRNGWKLDMVDRVKTYRKINTENSTNDTDI